MTREQMNKQYPNRWLGIRDVQYDENSHKMLSADVVYTDKTASDIALMAVAGENIQPLYTTPDTSFHVGAVM